MNELERIQIGKQIEAEREKIKELAILIDQDSGDNRRRYDRIIANHMANIRRLEKQYE